MDRQILCCSSNFRSTIGEEGLDSASTRKMFERVLHLFCAFCKLWISEDQSREDVQHHEGAFLPAVADHSWMTSNDVVTRYEIERFLQASFESSALRILILHFGHLAILTMNILRKMSQQVLH